MGEGMEVSPRPVSIEGEQGYNAVERARSIVEQRLERLNNFRKEAVYRLLDRKRLPLALMTAAVIATSGCGNTQKPIELPFFGAEPTATAAATATKTPEQKPTSTPIPSPTSTPEATATPAGPNKLKYKDKLPEDVVSDEELWEKYHTRIWNTPDVNLRVRRAALTREPVFQTMKKLVEEKRTIGVLGKWNSKEMRAEEEIEVELATSFDIVLLPGDMVRTKNLTQEQRQKLPEFVNALQKREEREFNAYKTRSKNSYQEKMELLQKEKEKTEEAIANGDKSKESFLGIIQGWMDLTRDINKNIDQLDYNSFIDKYPEAMYGLIPAAGLYFHPELDMKGYGLDDFQPSLRYYIAIAVPASGGGIVLDPDRSSFVDASQFHVSEDPRLKYPVVPMVNAAIGWNMRHELAHHDSDHPQTDFVALERFKQAYQDFLKGDDTGFYFIFETPKGNIITKIDRSKSENNIEESVKTL